MQIGIDSFAAIDSGESESISPEVSMAHLIERIEQAEASGLDIFGIGEHHRKEFLDSAPVVILAA